MNILIVSANSPYESAGGIERYTANFIKYCRANRDVKVTFLFAASVAQPPKTDDGVKIYFSRALSSPKDLSVKSAAAEFYEDVDHIATEEKIDVICAENFHLAVPAYSFRLNMLSGLRGIPLALRLHSFASTELQTELINQLDWRLISCVSRSVAGDCFHKGADIGIISTDYLGVDDQVFKPNDQSRQALRDNLSLPQDSRIVTTAARIILGKKSILREKGIITTIKAFSKLLPRHPELRLIIAVGQAPESLAEEFKQSYKQLLGYLSLHGVDEKTVVKKFGLGEMAELYQASDVFVLPSDNETFGQVYIEAMACGTATIGTKVGGVPEIISDKRNGFLVTPRDASALAQQIEILLTDDAMRQRFIVNGRETVETSFTANQQFASFIESLKQLAK